MAQLTDLQKVQATAAFWADAGNTKPAPLPAGVVPTWASDNTAVFTVDNSEDASGVTAWVVSAGDGEANLTLTVPLPTPVTVSAVVTVSAGVAVISSATITFGDPVAK